MPEANLGKLFGRRKKATPTPKPTPKPSAEPIAAVVAPPPTAAPRAVPPQPTSVPRTVAAQKPRNARPRRTSAQPQPVPAATTTTANAPPAAAEYAVLPVDGPADAALRELATQRLLARSKGDRAATRAEACAPHDVKAVLSGTLTVRPDPQYGGYSATLELSAA